MLFRLRLLLVPLIVTALIVLLTSQFMVIKVRENSMAPTLTDGQWVVVLRGSARVRVGDVAVFVSPQEKTLAVKRFILEGGESPLVNHGWLVTPWGNWFLTGPQWNGLSQNAESPGTSVFLVGDNQFHSMDSRSYGYVAREKLIGRVLIRKNHG